MLYTNETHRQELHLAMLSPRVTVPTLRFYLNRPISTLEGYAQRCVALMQGVTDVAENGFSVIAMDSYLASPPVGTTVPDEDGLVLEFMLQPGANPTEAICQLARLLADIYDIEEQCTFVSGAYGQEDPASLPELDFMDYPYGFLDAQAATAHAEASVDA